MGGEGRWSNLDLVYAWPAILTVCTVGVPSLRKRTLVLSVAAVVLFPILVSSGNAEELDRFLGFLVAGATALAGDRGSWAWFLALVAAGLLPLPLLPWAYRRKYFSERSFQLAFVWIAFAATYGIVHQTPRFWGYALASLALYAAVTGLMLPLLLRRAARGHRPASLLVLRVFGSAGRSGRLLEHIGMRWRTVGPIHVIAGADTAITNLDLSEMFRFLTFRFRSVYVQDAADLEQRLAKLDCAPDPDGRYRVNDFFCFDDTWKATFTALLQRSDAVLLDLSGFGAANAGVAFELGHLLGSRALGSFVLVTDRKTDIDHLGSTLTALWRRLDPSAPTAALERPVLRVLRKPAAQRLVAALCDSAAAAG